MLTIALEGAHAPAADPGRPAADVLLPASADPTDWCRTLLERVRDLASGAYVPIAFRDGNVDFMLPRGTAVSL